MNDSTFLLPDSEIETIAQQYRFQDGKAINIGKNISTYKLGTEYASGGAGGISTVDDYMKFLEGLRTYKLLKKETLELMTTDRLTDKQKTAYWIGTHGYGLGVRCPKGDLRNLDFGWGGATCAFWAIDMENAISIYFGAHLLASPVQGIRSMIYRFAKAEMIDNSEFEELYKSLEDLYDYKLTY